MFTSVICRDTSIRFAWGDLRSHAWAIAYPLFILSLIAIFAHLAGATDTLGADWKKTFLNIGLMSSTGIVMVLITEEGFFRGWQWGTLKRAGQSDTQILMFTTLAFVLWHVSAVTLDTGFDLPAKEVPIYLINVTILGLVWGIFRMVSGSVLVPAVCHAIWNGINYPLFGFGEKIGSLGIRETHACGPEAGLPGILLRAVFLALIRTHFVAPSP